MERKLAILREISTRKLSDYKPYKKQQAFHDMGKGKLERCFMAANQSGKTVSGGAETAMHLTGDYPDWWRGKRFNRPIKAWASGPSNEMTRDNPQRLLMGEPGSWGSGMIPGNMIVSWKLARGVADYIDTVRVRHKTGGESILRFKAYEQGRQKWQGPTLDLLWFDEEPPYDIYSEGRTRLNAGDRGRGGISYITATPLLGITEVVEMFFPEPDSESRGLIQMTIDDVDHYDDKRRAEIVAQYKPHELDARTKGIPVLGSGPVFHDVTEEMLRIPPFEIPSHFRQISGGDFGKHNHASGFVRCMEDPDTKTFYITNEYKSKEPQIVIHASSIAAWGGWIPMAWPHDGHIKDRHSGDELATQYRNAGVNMMYEHATHPSGGFGTEAGVHGMYEAMITDRFKVFATCPQWFEEFRVYHRKDGEIVKRKDDLMSATRIAWMMRRFARTKAPSSRIPAFANTYDPFAEPRNEAKPEWMQ